MSVKLAYNRVEQFSNGTGIPYAGAKLFTYVGGSVNTKQTTYVESTGTTPNTNPIVLDSSGQLPQPIWLTTGLSYKFVLAPSTDTDPPTSPIWTLDGVTGVNDSSASQSEWIAGPAPTFVSATQFTLVGDQTTNFAKSRRVKATVTAGTVYGTITNSAFAALTTVTVALDSGNLDSGLSAISYGIVAAVNPSIDADMVNRKGTAVVSAATTDIWSIAGDYVHVTGATGPITSFGTAPYAGAQRTVIFDSTPSITHNATTLQLPGGLNILAAAAGDRAIVRADTTANMIVVDYIKASGLALVGTTVPRNYLSGLTLSTAGGSATMSVAAGQATDSTAALVMNLAASISKTTSAWLVGSGNGGLDTGAIANSTWYKFYEIVRPDTGVVDVIFTIAALATGPLMPASYTKFRYIGSGKTDGSAQWTAFIQTGDDFYWSTPPAADFNAAGSATAALVTLTVPTGLKVKAYMNLLLAAGAGGSQRMYISDPNLADVAPSNAATPGASITWNGAANSTVAAQGNSWTNTSAQIRHREGTTDGVMIVTLGWTDRRGRDD